jgi:hypothetical protein
MHKSHSDVEDVTETLDAAFSKNALSAEFGIELLPIAPWEAAAYCTSQALVSTFEYITLYILSRIQHDMLALQLLIAIVIAA